MKLELVFLLIFIIVASLKLAAQCQDFSVQVKDAYGYPLKNSTVSIKYMQNHAVETKQTNNDGEVVFNCQLVKSQPYIQLSVESKGYISQSRKEPWNGKVFRNIILQELPVYEKVRGEIAGKRTVVKSKVEEVKKEITKQTEKNSSNPNSNDANLMADYKRLQLDLELKQSEFDTLLKVSNTHSQSADDYRALYNEKSKDYDNLSQKFQELRDKLTMVEYAVSIELAECHCIEWSEDHLKVSLKAKDGRKNIVLTSTEELAVSIIKEGKNSSEDVSLLFDNPDEDKSLYFFSFRPNNDGIAEVLIKPRDGEFERTFGVLAKNPYNYRITFYNRALFPYRKKYKISLGTFIIKDIKENCGAKKPKLGQRA